MEDANGLALYTEILGLEEFEVVRSDREVGEGLASHDHATDRRGTMSALRPDQ